MSSGIVEKIDDPKQLELLFRKNKVLFKQAFNKIYTDINNNAIAQAWHERLNYQEEEINWRISSELKMVALIAFLTGLLAKSPQIFDIEPDYFFARNIGLIAFPMLMFYFAWKQGLSWKSMLLPIIAVAVSGVYINLLPKNEKMMKL